MNKKFLSLGAGVQSTTVLLLSCKGVLPKFDGAVFADTGWEPASTYSYLLWLKNYACSFGIPVHVVNDHNLHEETMGKRIRPKAKKGDGSYYTSLPLYVRGKNGTIGMLRRTCTKSYKIQPVHRAVKQLSGYKRRDKIPAKSIELWFGISLDEQRRARLSNELWLEHHYPLLHDIPMTRNDCLHWLAANNFPQPQRSACIGCPFRTNEEWLEIKARPDEWANAIAADKAIRQRVGNNHEGFLHRSAVPLEQANLEAKSEENTWKQECQGMCGT